MKTRLWVLVEWGLLLLALAAISLPVNFQWYVAVGLLLLVASFSVRAWRMGILVPNTGLEIPWVLGLVSAAVAAWISYDRSAASLQFCRLLAAAVLFYAVVSLREDNVDSESRLIWPAGGFLATAVALALYWPLHTDFSTLTEKLSIITRLGLGLHQVSPIIPGPYIHPNVAAGAMLAALPFGVALSVFLWRRQQRLLAALCVAATLLVTGGLFMTGSRGAWMALTGVLLAGLLVVLQRRFFLRPKLQVVNWTTVVTLGLAALLVVVLSGNLDRLVGHVPDPSGGIQSRAILWRQGWEIAQDYPFTGSGLMSFWMVHPVYNLLIDVAFIAHAHNTFLEVWIEQGVFGFIGLVLAGFVVAVWSWRALRRKWVSIWGWAGLAALLAVSLHGMVDVVFYVTRTLPVIGLLFGYSWYLNLTEEGVTQAPQLLADRTRRYVVIGLILSALGFACLVSVIWGRTLLSAWYANIGAVQQTGTELRRYSPLNFDTYPLDQARRDSDLSPALASFAQALAVNPANRTALQRRAEIELSLGLYPAASNDTQRLWDAGYRDEATRLLVGDSLVAGGQPDQAVQIVQGLTWARIRLLGQAWYRYWLHQDYRRAIDAWTAVLSLNPQEPGVADLIQQAKAKLK